MRRLLLAAVLAAIVCIPAQAQIDWIELDPMAIRSTRTDPVRLDIQMAAVSTVANIRLDLAAGGSSNLTPMGGGRFTISITAAQALFGYAADDVNHNFIGFLFQLDGSGATVSTYNLFINVLDTSVPAVQVKNRSSDARETTRILNLRRPLIGALNVQTAVQQFYAYHPDDFDFVQVVFTLPCYPGNRYHSPTRSDVTGIGLSPFNSTSQYGSAGRLLGLNVFPIDTLFDAGESAFSHETGHQWIMYLDNPQLQPGPHWPPSSMASGIMGFNIPGTNVGGEFPYIVQPAAAGFARLSARTAPKEFSDFDLYLMGLIPASQVRNGIIIEGSPCNNCTLPATTITINDVVNLHGPRLPGPSTSQKAFRFGTVVITRDRLLTDDEMALLEYFAARGEAHIPLPYTSGFARGTTYPFYLATRGLATADLRLTPKPRRRAARH